ncbi:hypothetical protein BKA58DRAFT_449081 [Alternaria rosae]|uniref:uncharacterized protein n=1 Tax=Alternaria rosae TaxID=1187941 RepID=UPI001E8DE0C7|nr:uncharacterized protein BKA58DRAFT_449081 [Alternaria rosae]KAH6861196.1 hypothetical protein BKA58DRAFT_449081 [Alternaria rosae]
MLQLNTDCQRRVLNYINTRSDLKSLCLVSKELNQLALEKLYKHIDIRLFSKNNTSYVLGLLKNVKENLQYTRELVVEDECIAEETTSVNYGTVGLPDLKCWVGASGTADVEPASFLARRSLPWWLHKKLTSNQRNITDLQVSLTVDLYSNTINELPVLCQRENDLKRLDMYIVDGSSLNGLLLEYFQAIGRNLQFLSLSAHIGTDVSKLLWNHVWEPNQPKLPLKELRLTGLRLTHMYSSLSTIIDFGKLLKLDLVECAGCFKFVSDITGAVPKRQFDLTHVALNELLSSTATVEPEDERNIHLVKFLKACPNLCSLHFGHWTLDPLPPDSIRHLTKLRTLHVHRSLIEMVGGLGHSYSSRWDIGIISMQVQKFANLMFGELYQNPNFKLETLIVGHLGPLLRKSNVIELDNGLSVNSEHYLPQFCFVRNRQQDLLGRTATAGVPVSRAVLRRTHDHTSILDVDAGVEAWKQWVGQAT